MHKKDNLQLSMHAPIRTLGEALFLNRAKSHTATNAALQNFTIPSPNFDLFKLKIDDRGQRSKER
jgi:hypothetical protein